MLTTKLLTPDLIDDLNTLFCSNKYTEKCFCMWHIIAVKAFHANGTDGNRESFTQLAVTEATPLGILAYQNGEPVGWCAVGPRERYARAIKAPTYKTKAEDDFDNVWLVPCFFVRKDARGAGLTSRLLHAAVDLASEHQADAIDGFPFTTDKKRSSSQIHVGFDSTFLACGFTPLRRPSDSRVVMRRVLKP